VSLTRIEVWYLFFTFVKKDAMNTFKDSIDNISKGGLAGALLGTLASAKAYKDTDNLTRKALKTGFFAGIGYFLGEFIEKKLFRKS